MRSSPSRTGRLYPQECSWYSFSPPKVMVQSEGNMSLKNPVTPPRIDPGTDRLVAQCLNHYTTPGPIFFTISFHEIRKRKANWIGHILRRNYLLKQVMEGQIKREMEVTRRRGRRHRKLLDDLKDRRGYCHLKEEALDRTIWRNCFGGGFVPVVRQNTEWMNHSIIQQ